MKIIVDANCAMKVGGHDADGNPVLARLLSGKLHLCLCPELRVELAKTPISEIFTDLALAGTTVEVDGEKIQADKKEFKSHCKSNDLHILALARLSHCRLLFSNDKPLHTDFTNLDIIPSPKGKIYQTCAHSHLLP